MRSKWVRAVMVVLAIVTWPITAFAASTQPQFVVGINNMIQSILTWILYLTPGSGALAVAFHQFAKHWSGGDVAQTEQHNRATKRVLVTVVIIELASAIVKWVISAISG